MWVWFLTSLISLFLYFPQMTSAKSYGASICNEPNLVCYVAKRGDTWAKLFPDETERDIVMRINRVNIRLHPGMKIAIPSSPHFGLMDFSPFPTQIDPPGEKVIYVSKKYLAFGAYDSNGSLQLWGPISGGKGYCPDTGKYCRTPNGSFSIQSKQGGGCVSTKFPVGRGGAPMPYCMFFHGGFALHGSYEVPGYHASHGCVRMYVNDARWLNQEFTDGESNVRVIVY